MFYPLSKPSLIADTQIYLRARNHLAVPQPLRLPTATFSLLKKDLNFGWVEGSGSDGDLIKGGFLFLKKKKWFEKYIVQYYFDKTYLIY